jgi:transcriptional regulator with XRE-family HTH domain
MASKETVSTKARHLRHLLRVALGQEEIGRRIAQAREEAGLTQAQMAERLGLAHPQSISKYERGETEVPPKRLRRIAEVTGKPMGFFVMDPEAQDNETTETLAAEVREVRALVESVLELLQDAAKPAPAEPPRAQSDHHEAH